MEMFQIPDVPGGPLTNQRPSSSLLWYSTLYYHGLVGHNVWRNELLGRGLNKRLNKNLSLKCLGHKDWAHWHEAI